MRLRFFNVRRSLPHTELARLVQIDYAREMAFIALAPDADGRLETLGVVRAIADPDNVQAEFAVIVRSDLKGKGLGKLLMKKLIAYCRSRGTAELVGEALPDNRGVLLLTAGLGFTHQKQAADDTVRLRLVL
jgi:acetyltransferase